MRIADNSKKGAVAVWMLLSLVSGCAFETQPVGPTSGGLDGDGVGASLGDAGVGDGGLDTATPDTTTPDTTTPGKLDPDNSTDVVVVEPTCTPGTERSSCPGTSCDPVTLTCTTLALASRGTCETCFTDSNCAEKTHRCVKMSHLDARFPNERTGFCLQVTDEVGSGCPPPFVVPLIDRESLSGGKVESYCGIYEKLTTCFAVRAFFGGEVCPGGRDDECPEGGICRGILTKGNRTEYRCTYACEDVAECSSPAATVSCAGFCGG